MDLDTFFTFVSLSTTYYRSSHVFVCLLAATLSPESIHSEMTDARPNPMELRDMLTE
jgi:hypothetical protein